MLLQTVKNQWAKHRDAVATKDTPSAGSYTWDPPGDATERKVEYIGTTLEAEIAPIHCGRNSGINSLELRASFNDNAGTATGYVFAARAGEDSIRLVCTLAWTAGTAETADSTARYWAKTTVVTPYWNAAISKSNDEATLGMSTVEFDIRGYDRFWVLIDALSSADNVTVEYSGY